MLTPSAMLAIVICLAQALGEAVAMWQTGTARRERRAEWTFYAVNIPYWLLVFGGVLEHQLSPTNPSALAVWIGSALAALGVCIRVVCHYQLEGGFSPFVELANNQQLVTQGLYSRIRHPMYVGSLLLFVGLPLLLGSPIAMALAVAASLALLVRIDKEEKFLKIHLPGYEEYANRTWRLIPCLW